jgi:hypothetical protein
MILFFPYRSDAPIYYFPYASIALIAVNVLAFIGPLNAVSNRW